MLLKLNKVSIVNAHDIVARQFVFVDYPCMPLTYIMFMFVEFILLC